MIHGYVKTKKHIEPEYIDKIFVRLNQNPFKQLLKVTYHKTDKNDSSAWGDHVWDLEFLSNGNVYFKQSCWLNRTRSFEIQIPDGIFQKLVSDVITHEVASTFVGLVRYDGDASEFEPDHNAVSNFYDILKEQDQELIPSEYRY